MAYPVQKREVFEFSAERGVDGVHIRGYVDVFVIEVDGIGEHDGADNVHGDVGRR